jgi:phthiodiolone/phenolphthiodiolone dimycocerosates ketoreductase
MMRITGRYADGWFPGTTRADEYGEQLGLVRTAALDAGRDPMAITPALIRFIVTGRSRAEIDEVVESDIAKVFTLNFPGEAWARQGNWAGAGKVIYHQQVQGLVSEDEAD